jgi:hypothetical protein
MRHILALGVVVILGAACGTEDSPVCYQPDLSNADICELLGDACTPAAGQLPQLSDMVQVAPSMDMPEGVVPQDSHNNLDIVWHQNRLFFAFRTAPSHFAGDQTYLYIVSTTDQKNWTLEWQFTMLTDLREPRLLSHNGKLFLYFAVLGYNPVAFEPQYSMVTEYKGGCDWTEPEQIFDPGFIPWRTRTIDGKAYLLGYVGGENIYENDGEPIRIHWLTTEDGRNFEPVVPGKPVVLEGGSSETDWVFADDGAVIAVSRNEAGDAESGWGSKICRAEPSALGDWNCVSDPKKYDSPIMFKKGSDIYLIARRNVTDTGNYDLGYREMTPAEQTSAYNQDYWTKPKRCSLWSVDPDSLVVTFVMDLPSNGDTCFPGVVQLNEDQFLVYNYTSPLDDPELKWFEGQTMPTFIYRTTLTLP